MRFFIFLWDFMRDFIESGKKPAILCPCGRDKLFSSKFGMKSAIIGLSRAWGSISHLGYLRVPSFIYKPKNGQGSRGFF
jgi:hypothetical protein